MCNTRDGPLRSWWLHPREACGPSATGLTLGGGASHPPPHPQQGQLAPCCRLECLRGRPRGWQMCELGDQ